MKKAKVKIKQKAEIKPKIKAKASAKSKSKPDLLVELTNKKMEAQKSGATTSKSFGKFQRNKPRNENNSNVGPSWGGRKGN